MPEPALTRARLPPLTDRRLVARYDHYENFVRGAGFKMGEPQQGPRPAQRVPAPVLAVRNARVSHSFLLRNLPAAPPPADYGGHDSLFHSNAIYTTNGWNCEERGGFACARARAARAQRAE